MGCAMSLCDDRRPWLCLLAGLGAVIPGMGDCNAHLPLYEYAFNQTVTRNRCPFQTLLCFQVESHDTWNPLIIHLFPGRVIKIPRVIRMHFRQHNQPNGDQVSDGDLGYLERAAKQHFDEALLNTGRERWTYKINTFFLPSSIGCNHRKWPYPGLIYDSTIQAIRERTTETINR
jgi:hypothetical protein